jgi:hypothetical protein
LDVRFAGRALGSPGPAGCGVVLRDRATASVLQELSVFLPDHATEGEAEMTAALLGVRAAVKLGERLPVRSLLLEGGSPLIVRQIAGQQPVLSPTLASVRAQLARDLEAGFGGSAEVRHEPNADYAHAIRLASVALETRASAVTTDDALIAGLVGAAQDVRLAAPDRVAPGPRAAAAPGAGAAASRPARVARAPQPDGAGALTQGAIYAMQLAELDHECARRGIAAAGMPSMARRDALLSAMGAPLNKTRIRRMALDALRVECLRRGLRVHCERGAPLHAGRLRAQLRDALQQPRTAPPPSHVKRPA